LRMGIGLCQNASRPNAARRKKNRKKTAEDRGYNTANLQCVVRS
jgi:hypothetical protein